MVVFRSLVFFLFLFSSFQSYSAFQSLSSLGSKITRVVTQNKKAFRNSSFFRTSEVFAFGSQEAKNRRLFRAARKGDLPEIKKNLEEGAKLNASKKKGFLALRGLIDFPIELEQAFLEHTPVQAALESGELDSALYLLELGAKGAGGSDQEIISSTAGQGKAVTEAVFYFLKSRREQKKISPH